MVEPLIPVVPPSPPGTRPWLRKTNGEAMSPRRRSVTMLVSSQQSGLDEETTSESVSEWTAEHTSTIVVAVRKRPKRPGEEGQEDILRVESSRSISVMEPKTRVDGERVVEPTTFHFDVVFDENERNHDVFNATTLPLVEAVRRGGSAIVFAFGQTGSGKTHTMLGPLDKGEEGIFSLAAREVIANLKGMRLSVSFFEIYGTNLYDLLNSRSKVMMLEDEYKSINLVGLTEHVVTDHESLMKLMSSGGDLRACGATHCNDHSSRSHAVLVFNIRPRRHDSLFGRITFIDLAGSERGAATLDMDKKARREGAEINKSLLALKECIRALDQKKSHIPFRGSKLTQVLRDCFVGTSVTCLIANVSPCQSHCEDTLNTLRYADRIKELSQDESGGPFRDAPPVPCKNCGQPIYFGKKLLHRCPQKEYVTCVYCREEVERRVQEQHNLKCQRVPTQCPHCNMRVLRGDLERHVNKCGKVRIVCPLCEESVFRDVYPRHVNKDCPHAKVPCPQCREAVDQSEMDEHTKECKGAQPRPRCKPKAPREKIKRRRSVVVVHDLPTLSPRPIPLLASETPPPRIEKKRQACKHCGRAIPLETMEQHLQRDCPLIQIPCPFATHGCHVQVARMKLHAHLHDAVDAHLTLLQAHVVQLETENQELRAKFPAPTSD